MTNEELIGLTQDLRTQLKCYENMIHVNQQQQDLLSGDDSHNPDELLALVGQKQNLMSDVTRIEERAKSLKNQWPDIRDGIAQEQREEIDALIAKLSETIKTLISMEDEAQKLLEGVMQQTQQGLKNIQQKSQVNRAYAAYAGKQTNPRFVDKRSGS